MDVYLQNLERIARGSGSPSDYQIWQVARDRLGSNSDDAEYWCQYYQICEMFIIGQCSLERSEDQLAKLNTEFQFKIHSKVKRKAILGSHLSRTQYYEDGTERGDWIPSQYC